MLCRIPTRCRHRLMLPRRGAVGADADLRFPLRPFRMRAYILRCRGSSISPFCRESPGNVPLRHVMPWSLHFVFRGGPEKKGRKEKGPPARRKIPVARTPGPLILALTFLIHFNDYIKKNHSSAYTPHSLACVCTACAQCTMVSIQGGLPKGKPTQFSSNANDPISPAWLRRV